MILVFIFLSLIIIISILFFVLIMSTIRLKIENLKVENYINTKEYKIIIQIYFLDKIKILSIKINNEKLKKIYMNNQLKNVDFNKLKEITPNKKAVFKAIKKIIPKVEKLDLKVYLGTEDAILTSYAVTILASLIGIILPHIVKDKRYEKIKYVIKPIYNKNIVNMYLDGIISLKIVHIINMICFLAKKGRDKNERTSNRRTYAYSHEFN